MDDGVHGSFHIFIEGFFGDYKYFNFLDGCVKKFVSCILLILYNFLVFIHFLCCTFISRYSVYVNKCQNKLSQ